MFNINKLYTTKQAEKILPHLQGRHCNWTKFALFTPHYKVPKASKRGHRLNIYDLVTLQILFYLFESGLSSEQIRDTINDAGSFRCNGLHEDNLLFLSTGGRPGQEISRFLEACNFNVQIVVHRSFVGKTAIAFCYEGECPVDILGWDCVTTINAEGIYEEVRRRLSNGDKQGSDACM
jgi:hypothetical protein